MRLYILSQVFVIINYVLLICTYQVKSRKTILILNIVSLLSSAVAYFLLSAYSALAMTFISLLRNTIYLINEKKNGVNKNNIYMLIIIYLLCIILAYFTYDGFLSLMSVFATMIYTYAVWQKSTKVYKWLGIPVGITWFTYNVYIKSLFGMIFEFVLMIAVIIGIVRANREE